MSAAVTWLQNSFGVDMTGDWNHHVHLNVGGTLYTTRRHTLRALKDNRVFGPILDGRVRRCEDGSFLIDRDGALFRYIIAYLRDGRLTLPDNFWEWEMLLQEIRYYDLPEMEKSVMDSFEYQKSVFRRQLPRCVCVWWPPASPQMKDKEIFNAGWGDAPAPACSSTSSPGVIQPIRRAETVRRNEHDVAAAENQTRAPREGNLEVAAAAAAALSSSLRPSASSHVRIVPPLPGLTVEASSGRLVTFRETQVLENLDDLVTVLLADYGFSIQHWDVERGRVFLTLPGLM
ncbi:hypothetical protein JKF63_06533 [Porcisia hertigi]|uniref:Potassium channel tetramerisation-type BTB domain-containing protein n=1 Tax=Porcisia hertigi TaxID=2761500 RepID=A0A836I916_9TRYP|nr:hypothetical protein JKF63_06533 [Porcisia hertigi]